MAEEAARRRAWIEGGLQPQPDGRFLVRPFGWLGGVVALPDAATKDRYVAYRQRTDGVVSVAWVVGTLWIIICLGFLASRLLGDVQEPGWVWLCAIGGGLLVSVVLAHLRHRARLKRLGAFHVPRERWDAARAQDNWSYFTDNELRERTIHDIFYLCVFTVLMSFLFIYNNDHLFDPVNVMLLIAPAFSLGQVVGDLREMRSRRRLRGRA